MQLAGRFFHMGGRSGVGVYTGGRRSKNVCTIFKSIIPGSQLLHKVLLWKDWTRLNSILSLPHCLGQVQLSALPRIVSWCDGPHKDEPIKTLTDILELNKLSDGPVDRRSLTGLFSKNFKLLLTWKTAPDIIHLLEKEGITQCVYHIHLWSLIW